MNIAVTDGTLLTPAPFAQGLGVYSSGDGRPGTDTYANAANAALAFADQDFGDCLELQKNAGTVRIRYMGETPILPGCYLRITARIKAISGNLPNVRIAAFAARSNGNAVGGVTTTGAQTTLTDYGSVVEVTAIVGAGNRPGVDMVWGSDAAYGHFGIDLTGPSGGILRVDDFEIADVTSAFVRDMLAVVDVRDYGAVGDDSTDDSAAFDRANAAANGRTVLVPAGTFRLNSDVTIDHPVRFEGTLSMPTSAILLLRRQFDLPTYIEAFENEELAFKKAFQALLNNTDHESLDMGGRKVAVTQPLDMQAAVPNRTSFQTRRVIRNGQLEAQGSSAWATQTTTSQGTYTPSNPREITGVTNIANVQVGSLITGSGVGREIYVRDVNIAQQKITLNAPLYDAAGTQNFTFRRFQFVLDFSGFATLSKFEMDSVEIQANNKASCILLANAGLTFTLRDCWLSRPKDRGVASHGGGCQGMIIDRCQFLSSEDALDVSERVSIGFNVNANDAKIRNCRATRFRHFGLLAGGNNLVLGNHFFQGDEVQAGVRSAGLIIARAHSSSVITGNYIDNCFIEWTNERDPTPGFTTGFSFSAFSLTDNVFLSGDVAPWFSYIVVKPHGTGHFIAGLSVAGNKFRSINGSIDRVERVDTSFADLNYARMKDINFYGNSFHSVTKQVSNPLRLSHAENTADGTWTIETDGHLPFESYAVSVESVVPSDGIRTAGGQMRSYMPYAQTRQGPAQDRVTLNWQEPVRGAVQVVIRMDD